MYCLMDKQKVIYSFMHTMAYYSALKNPEILIQATIWMNLKKHYASEIRQLQKQTHKNPQIMYD